MIKKKKGVSRNKIYEALQAEGLKYLSTKFANLHLLLLYQKKIAYGHKNFPRSIMSKKSNIKYSTGISPIAEKLHDKSYLGFEMCLLNMDVN